MKKRITATELARNIGDILARIRYRRESFLVERNGRLVARLLPVDASPAGTVRDALTAWIADASADDTFADDLARVNTADTPAANPWVS